MKLRDRWNLNSLRGSPTVRIGMLLSLFLALFVMSYMLVSWAVNAKKHDSVDINLAGRQRMLAQKYAREINLVLIGMAASDWEMVISQKRNAEETAELFEITLHAFLEGGHVQIGFSSPKTVYLPPVKAPHIREQLKQIGREWGKLKKSALIALRSDSKSLANNKYTARLQTQADTTVVEMDNVVILLQQESNAKLEKIRAYQPLMLGVGCLLFISILTFISLKIVHPREQAEKRLKASERRFASVVKSANDAIIVANRSGEIVLWNEAAGRIFGFTIDEIMGQSLTHIMPDHFKKRHGGGINRFIETGNPTITRGKLELEGLRKDGRKIPIELSLASWKTEEDRFFTIIIRDITERKCAEEELKQAWQQAKHSNIIKSEFLAHMSHEIRTPMNGIIGFVNILMENSLTKEQTELLEIINKSANNLMAIINNILDISKVESDKLILEEVDFDIEVLIHDVCSLVKFNTDERNTEIFVDVEDIPTMLSGDPTRLRQIITNLVGNACKFTKSGEIVLKVSLLEEEKLVYLQFAVHDTGIGIPKEKLEIIFNPFTQEDSSTTRKFGGTGLGLAISKKLSELMGGKMWVESKLGEGSTFYFTAKFKKTASHSKMTIPIKPKELSGKQAIIVDGNKTALNIITRMVNNFGMNPITFKEVEPAIEYLKTCERLPDVGIIGVIMPQINDLELRKLVQKDNRFSQVPMIAHTSNSTPGDSNLCRKAGFAGYLPKPTQKLSLLSVLRSVLGVEGNKKEKIVTQHSAKEDILKNTYILVVEDNKVNQKLIIRMLEKWGCKVDVADDGLIAVEKLKNEHDYSLAFMDIQMPNMDGLEAAKKIRQTGNKIPIIAMTANAMTGDKEICLKAGMNDYLSKPIKKEDVIAKIQQWCEWL